MGIHTYIYIKISCFYTLKFALNISNEVKIVKMMKNVKNETIR